MSRKLFSLWTVCLCLAGGGLYAQDEEELLDLGGSAGQATEELFDEGGEVIDEGGEVIDETGEIVDEGGEVIDEGGEIVDESGEVIDEGGEIVDESGEVIDEGGEVIDETGEIVDEGGEFPDQGEEGFEDFEDFFDDSEFITGEEFPEEEYFDPDDTTFDEWFGSEEVIDWDGDGEFNQEDYDLLIWLSGEETGQDVDGDGFLDEEDYALSQWLGGEEDADANGDGVVDEDDFTLFQQFTQGIFANEIYNVFHEVDHDHALMSWDTSEPANSVVKFGRTQLDGRISSGDNEVEHRLVFSNLEAGVSYRFSVNSTDASGNGATESAEAVFTTDPELDLRAPQILSGPEVVYRNDRSAAIRWTTDEAATGAVEFGMAESLGATRKLPATGQVHELALTNLSPATTYFFRVYSADLSNNGPTRSAIASFTTEAQPDLRPPVISSVAVVPEDSSAIIRWTTDELGDSFVEFGTDEALLSEKTGDAKDVLNHEVVLTNLRPATAYFFKAGSVDRANNPPAQSQVQSFTTLAAADRTPPARPAGLRAQPGAGQVALTWTANAEGDLAGYNLYRILGQEVRVLVEGEQEAGFHLAVWDGADGAGRLVGSGVYFYLLQAPGFTQARKMVLLK